MDTPQLKLVAPSSHDIYFNINGDSFSDPLCGNVVVTSKSEARLANLKQLRLCLVRIVSGKIQDSVDQNASLLNRIFRQYSTAASASTEESRSCSIIEELTQPVPELADSQVGNSPGEGKVLGIPFSLPLPVNIPGTAKTDLGTVSYALAASLHTTNGCWISTNEPIHLVRRVIPEQEAIQHTRTYPNSTVVANIALTQNLITDSASNLSFDASVLLRRPMLPGGRSTEFRCTVIRGLRWRVEEVTKLVHQCRDEAPRESTPVDGRSFVRGLCTGTQKGYWGTRQNPIVRERPAPELKESSVDIPFTITIPKTSKPTYEVDMCCYSFDSSRLLPDSLPASFESYSFTTEDKLVILVEHRLRLDILTSEDTFDARTRDLVDRKPLRTALNATFPLQIIDWAKERFENTAIQGNPPRYEDIPLAPPDYVHFP
ncbi:hypothetical protein N7492_003021 [Penicillium capsulatum]|uniref:LDB19 N-terminal domain-containing protein n=1 Tax=Penicillium capsulatum TaxID=69766 RepID=A0A9W9IME5_9EURO|nr:hypothetical protein N7492_003021 [Penicillium capsulatum]KAJ6122388.1 hypothetical protein N7512_004853 [Penicillium capsulatum]